MTKVSWSDLTECLDEATAACWHIFTYLTHCLYESGFARTSSRSPLHQDEDLHSRVQQGALLSPPKTSLVLTLSVARWLQVIHLCSCHVLPPEPTADVAAMVTHNPTKEESNEENCCCRMAKHWMGFIEKETIAGHHGDWTNVLPLHLSVYALHQVFDAIVAFCLIFKIS